MPRKGLQNCPLAGLKAPGWHFSRLSRGIGGILNNYSSLKLAHFHLCTTEGASRYDVCIRGGGGHGKADIVREVAGIYTNKRAMALYTCVNKGNKSMTELWQPLRPLQPPNSLGAQIRPQIWNQWPQLSAHPWAYCLYGMDHFGSIRGHYSLQTALEVKSDLIFQISDPNYLLIHVHITSMVWALLAASEVTTASKQPQRSCLTSDFKSVTSIIYVATCLDAPTCNLQ